MGQDLVSVKIGLRSFDRWEQAQAEAGEPKSTENVGYGQEQSGGSIQLSSLYKQVCKLREAIN